MKQQVARQYAGAALFRDDKLSTGIPTQSVFAGK